VNGLLSFAQLKADDIIGVWLTNGNEPAKIKISKATKYYGRIVSKKPNRQWKTKLDTKNQTKQQITDYMG
jgi:hypothetical protein